MLEPNVAPAMLKLLERAKGYYDDIRNPLTNPVGIRYLDVNPKAWQTFTATPFCTSRVEAIEKALTPEQRVNNDIVLGAREVCRRLWCNIVYANGQFGVGDFWNKLKGEPVKAEFGDGMITRYGISPHINKEEEEEWRSRVRSAAHLTVTAPWDR